MLILTGNGRLTRDVELRTTRSGDSVAYELHDVVLEYGAKPRRRAGGSG